jgi:hypothetical protein
LLSTLLRSPSPARWITSTLSWVYTLNILSLIYKSLWSLHAYAYDGFCFNDLYVHAGYDRSWCPEPERAEHAGADTLVSHHHFFFFFLFDQLDLHFFSFLFWYLIVNDLRVFIF